MRQNFTIRVKITEAAWNSASAVMKAARDLYETFSDSHIGVEVAVLEEEKTIAEMKAEGR